VANRLDKTKVAFQRSISDAEDFVRRCKNARHARHNRAAFAKTYVGWAHELATLKMIVASELFLEVSLGLYAIGNRAGSGYRPRRRRKIDISLPEVLDVFRGDRPYVGWVDPGAVIGRAENWLRSGEPFRTALSSTSQLLSFVQKMRNVIAHESESAFDKYEQEARRLYGARPKEVSPGCQLAAPPPAGLTGVLGVSLFDGVAGTYRWIASTIVP
jgi:hypothetical protein